MRYKKILKYWKAAQNDPERELSPFQMDVTSLRCEEDDESIQLIDQTGRVIAEFGPGRPYDGWMLTVEYAGPR